MNLNFNLKSLQIFASIMEQGTLTKAAEAHFLSESAASRQIASLENQIGFKLFSREKRQLIPTYQGREFNKEAQRIIYGLQELPDILDNIKRHNRPQLRVITIPRLIRRIVSPAIARTCYGHPELKVNVDVQPMRYLQRWAAGFQFHLGLGRLPAKHPDIITRPFCSLPVVAISAQTSSPVKTFRTDPTGTAGRKTDLYVPAANPAGEKYCQHLSTTRHEPGTCG